MQSLVPELSDLTGLWRRSSIRWPDGRRDTTTAVHWLQAQSFYADLRRPPDRPSFAAVGCLREIGADQLVWLARQEGFAGVLRAEGGFFEWQRHIDFQPQSSHSDVGRLRFEGETMIEEGRDIAYIEHWRREIVADHPRAAIRLRDGHDGCIGFIVRVGVTFMYARARRCLLSPVRGLAEQVQGASCLEAAQDLIDCEISLGSVGVAGWIIDNSTLPFREGRELRPEPRGQSGDAIETSDLSPDGEAVRRRWEITDAQGPLGALLASARATHRRIVPVAPDGQARRLD